eukprot:9468783-Pyramimonas_sp.AAC.1
MFCCLRACLVGADLGRHFSSRARVSFSVLRGCVGSSSSSLLRASRSLAAAPFGGIARGARRAEMFGWSGV